jgi:hypothetical protein
MFVQDTLVSTLGCDSHFTTRVVGSRVALHFVLGEHDEVPS